MTAAVLSTLGIGIACSTLEMKVNFVRAIGGDIVLVRAEGKVIHLGSSIATAEGRLVDRQGKLYAHAVTTCATARVRAAARNDAVP